MINKQDTRTEEIYFCEKCGSELIMFSDEFKRGLCVDLGCNDFGMLVCCGEGLKKKRRKSIVDMMLR